MERCRSKGNPGFHVSGQKSDLIPNDCIKKGTNLNQNDCGLHLKEDDYGSNIKKNDYGSNMKQNDYG